jgi:ankyrin repeat protein
MEASLMNGMGWTCSNLLKRSLLLALASAPLSEGAVTFAEERQSTGAAKIDFQKDVAPILSRHCIQCHGAEFQLADLRLDQRKYVVVEGQDRELIKPGNSKESLLIRRLTDKTLGLLMPPGFPLFPQDEVGLAAAQIETLTRWVDEGAQWPAEVTLPIENKAAANPKVLALLAAIRQVDRQAVEQLLADRTLTSARTASGATPLIQAAIYADADLIEWLLDRGADVNAADEAGTTALMVAAGDPAKVRLLLARDAKVDAQSRFGRTPLLVASAYAGNLESVELLLQAGAKATDQDQFGETALTSASKRGDAAVVEALIEAGADIHAAGGFGGRTPLEWAAEEGSPETIACLLKHGAGKNPKSLQGALFNAAVRGPVQAVKLLLESGAKPNGPAGFGGYTPLMGAAYSENVDLETVKLLLAAGADVNARAPTGETALSLARRRGNSAVLDVLAAAAAK